MNTLESCMTACPIVQGIDDEVKLTLFELHRRACLERRIGQLGILCGVPQGPEKDEFSRDARQTQRSLAAVAV